MPAAIAFKFSAGHYTDIPVAGKACIKAVDNFENYTY